MDDEFVTFEVAETVSRRFRRQDLFVIGLQLVNGVANAVASATETAMVLAGAHVNWMVDQEDFHQEAALEIESLVSGEYEEVEYEEDEE